MEDAISDFIKSINFKPLYTIHKKYIDDIYNIIYNNEYEKVNNEKKIEEKIKNINYDNIKEYHNCVSKNSVVSNLEQIKRNNTKPILDEYKKHYSKFIEEGIRHYDIIKDKICCKIKKYIYLII